MKKLVKFVVISMLALLLAISIIACTDPCDHSGDKWTVVTEAGCESDGLKELRCAEDNRLVDSAVIAATGHDYKVTGNIEPTCTENGKKTYTCSHNSAHTYSEPVAALGHDEGNYVVVTAADCENDGLRELRCGRDGHVLNSEVITATDHDYILTNTVAATCTVSGKKTFVCSHNSAHTYDEPLAALGHDEGTWVDVTELDCETDERKELRCTRDAHVLEVSTTPATNHAYSDWVLKSAATSSRPMQEKRVCSNNSAHEETRYVAPVLALGAPSGEVAVDSDGTWFVLNLSEAKTLQLGYLQKDSSGSSSSFEAYIYTATFNRIAVASNGHASICSVTEVEAGTYYIKLANYSGTKTGRVRVDDFDVIKQAMDTVELDRKIDMTLVNNIGTWLKLELANDTLVQFSRRSDNGFLHADIYSENDFSTKVMGTSPYEQNIALLEAGVYYVRVRNLFFGDCSGSVVVVDLAKKIEHAPDIDLDVPTQIGNIETEGSWYALTITQTTHIRFIYTEQLLSLAVQIIRAEDFSVFVSDAHNSGTDHVATIPAGNYFVRVYYNGTGSAEGAVKIADWSETLESAELLQLDTPKQLASFDSSGEWFRLSLTQQTHISFVASVTNGNVYSLIYSADNLSESQSISSGVKTLAAGDYYIYAYASGNSLGAGTVEVVNIAGKLSDAETIVFGTVNQITLTSNKEICFFKLVLTEETRVGFTLTATSGSISGAVYSENDLGKAVGSATGSSLLKAGTYYLQLTASASTGAAGSIVANAQ